MEDGIDELALGKGMEPLRRVMNNIFPLEFLGEIAESFCLLAAGKRGPQFFVLMLWLKLEFLSNGRLPS